MIKISDDGSQTETELLEGAGFKVYLISELSKVKDGTLKPDNGTEFVPQDLLDMISVKRKLLLIIKMERRYRQKKCLRTKRDIYVPRNFRMENMYVSKVPFRKIWKRFSRF